MKQIYLSTTILFLAFINLNAQTNIATNATVSVSSSFGNGYDPGDLIDGNKDESDWSTGWYANYFNSSNPQFATFDFGIGNEIIINEYHLYGQSDSSVNPSSHRFEARNTASEAWITLNTIDITTNPGINEYTFSNNNAYRYYRVIMTQNGSSGTGGFQEIELFANTTLSINEFAQKNLIKLFPNPTTDFIQISGLIKDEKYSVSNISGSVIKKEIITNNAKIDVRDFSNGLYFLKFDNGNTIKFIKK